MDARELALSFRDWAIKNGMIGLDRMAGPIEEDRFVSRVQNQAILTAATQVLQRRKINFIGFNENAGEVLVFTNTKVTKAELETIPNEVDGIKIVFQKAGAASVGSKIPASHVPPFTLRNDKYTCGSSIYVGNQIGAGTLGALVQDNNGMILGLSNNHVTGGCNYSDVLLPIVAPGQLDVGPGGHDPFTIGYHYGLMPFVDGAPDNVDASENIDAAIFKIKNPDAVSSFQGNAFDTPASVRKIEDNMEVLKFGRTSGLTKGRVRGQAPATSVDYFLPELEVKKRVFFDPLYIVESSNQKFAEPGDSGSLVTYFEDGGDRYSVGIVVATSKDESLTFISNLDTILDYFEVSLVTNHNV